jgi:hypothetical protein
MTEKSLINKYGYYADSYICQSDTADCGMDIPFTENGEIKIIGVEDIDGT